MRSRRSVAPAVIAAGCLIGGGAAWAGPIDSSAALAVALKAARGGELFSLAPGDYGRLAITGRAFQRPVTITSADPQRRAAISSLEVRHSSGLTLSDLDFVAQPAPAGTTDAGITNAFRILSSDRIVLDRIRAHGDGTGTLATEVSGLLVRDSREITIARSEFRRFHNAIGHLDDEHLTITGNWFHDLRDDGVRGGGSSFVTISKNRFDSLHRDPDDTDHPDCIQFWTTNTSRPAHDLTIADNLYLRGSGRSVQGVFLGNEVSIPYERVTVVGNVLAGTGYNGIVVKAATAVVLKDNTVARFPDQTSRLRLIDSRDAVVTANSAAEFGWTDRAATRVTNIDVRQSGNRLIGPVNDGGRALASAWQARQSPQDLWDEAGH